MQFFLDMWVFLLLFDLRMQRRVLHRFVMMAKKTMPGRADNLDGEDKVAQESK